MNTTILLLICIVLLYCAGSFFGFIGGMTKGFKKNPSSSISSQDVKRAQQQSIEDTKEKHQQYMDTVKQRIQDSSMKKY